MGVGARVRVKARIKHIPNPPPHLAQVGHLLHVHCLKRALAAEAGWLGSRVGVVGQARPGGRVVGVVGYGDSGWL